MKSFGTLLTEYLEKLEITQSYAAQLIGCSRAMIYSVLNDEKKLTEAKFQHLLTIFDFTDEQISNLRFAYYKDKYPAGAIERIYRINHFMQGRHQCENPRKAEPAQIPSESCAVSGTQNLEALISAVILDKTTKTITTNYSFCDKVTDDAVFFSLIQRRDRIDFRHIITFDNSNSSDVNISNIFLSIRFIRHGFNPMYRFAEEKKENELYPYFIITDNYLILFNHKSACGMFITEDSIIRSTLTMAETVLEECTPLATYHADIFELKSSITKVSSNKLSYAFGNSACIIPFMPEFIERIAADNLPNRELLVKIAIDHYKKLGYHSGAVMFPQSALERFAAEGRVCNFPLNWTKPMSFEDRQTVLEILKGFAEGENPKIRILYDQSMGLSDKFLSMDIFERYMCISGSFADSENPYCGEYSIFIRNTNIISDFRFYIDFNKRNRIHLESDIAVEFIDSLKLECERNKK